MIGDALPTQQCPYKMFDDTIELTRIGPGNGCVITSQSDAVKLLLHVLSLAGLLEGSTSLITRASKG